MAGVVSGPTGYFANVPDAVLQTNLFPFIMDPPQFTEEQEPDEALRELARRWLSYGPLPEVNRHFRDLVAKDRRNEGGAGSVLRGSGIAIMNIYDDLFKEPRKKTVEGEDDSVIDDLAQKRRWASVRIYIQIKPQALGSIQMEDGWNILHAVLYSAQVDERHYRFVAFLAKINRTHRCGLLDQAAWHVHKNVHDLRPIDLLIHFPLKKRSALKSPTVRYISTLLQGWDVNRNNRKWGLGQMTALMFATEKSLYNNKNPRDPAREENDLELTRVLLEAGADPTKGVDSPLELLVSAMHTDGPDRLLKDDKWDEMLSLFLKNTKEVPFSLIKHTDHLWIPSTTPSGGSTTDWSNDGGLIYSNARRIRMALGKHMTKHPPRWLRVDNCGKLYSAKEEVTLGTSRSSARFLLELIDEKFPLIKEKILERESKKGFGSKLQVLWIRFRLWLGACIWSLLCCRKRSTAKK